MHLCLPWLIVAKFNGFSFSACLWQTQTGRCVNCWPMTSFGVSLLWWLASQPTNLQCTIIIMSALLYNYHYFFFYYFHLYYYSPFHSEMCHFEVFSVLAVTLGCTCLVTWLCCDSTCAISSRKSSAPIRQIMRAKCLQPNWHWCWVKKMNECRQPEFAHICGFPQHVLHLDRIGISLVYLSGILYFFTHFLLLFITHTRARTQVHQVCVFVCVFPCSLLLLDRTLWLMVLPLQSLFLPLVPFVVDIGLLKHAVKHTLAGSLKSILHCTDSDTVPPVSAVSVCCTSCWQNCRSYAVLIYLIFCTLLVLLFWKKWLISWPSLCMSVILIKVHWSSVPLFQKLPSTLLPIDLTLKQLASKLKGYYYYYYYCEYQHAALIVCWHAGSCASESPWITAWAAFFMKQP